MLFFSLSTPQDIPFHLLANLKPQNKYQIWFAGIDLLLNCTRVGRLSQIRLNGKFLFHCYYFENCILKVHSEKHFFDARPL